MGKRNILLAFCGVDIPEDNPCQLRFQFFLRLIRQLRHEGHIHPCFFCNGYCEGFAGGIYGGNGNMGTDGALGEHIRLALEVALLVQHFQRTQQEITGVIAKGQTVAPAAQQAVFLGVVIVEVIQIALLPLNVHVGIPLGLVVNELTHTVPEVDHATDAVFCGNRYLHGIHAAVFPEVHLAIDDGVTEVSHIGIGRNGAVIFFQFLMLILGNMGIEC